MISKMEFFCGNRMFHASIQTDLNAKTVPRIGDHVRHGDNSYLVTEVWHVIDSITDRIQLECSFSGSGIVPPCERSEERRSLSK
jgi:hypothetical protein